jgi:hypothetical protein
MIKEAGNEYEESVVIHRFQLKHKGEMPRKRKKSGNGITQFKRPI